MHFNSGKLDGTLTQLQDEWKKNEKLVVGNSELRVRSALLEEARTRFEARANRSGDLEVDNLTLKVEKEGQWGELLKMERRWMR